VEPSREVYIFFFFGIYERERTEQKWKVNIIMNFRQVERKGVSWIRLTQDRG
jgi:1,4-dihydroxy-2-naphthoyl-CoA synthase